MGKKAARMMTASIKDNRKIVNYIEMEKMDDIIQLIKKDRVCTHYL